jgi:hypothetical protein
LIFIGISGVLFCGITAYPVDMIKDHLIMRLSATLALSCLHAYLWSMLLDYIGTKYGLPKTAAEAKTSSGFYWQMALIGSITVAMVQLDRKAKGS